MKKGEATKEHLIACAGRLFWRNGYAATGLSEILKEAKLTKGSFYFYFKSKEDLAVAVVCYYHRVVYEWLAGFAADADWETFVTHFTGAMLEGAGKGEHYGCPIAVVGMELAFSHKAIAGVYMEAMEEMQGLFGQVLMSSGLPSDQADSLAGRLFAIYEGNLLLYRMSTDASYIEKLKEQLLATYREYQQRKARI